MRKMASGLLAFLFLAGWGGFGCAADDGRSGDADGGAGQEGAAGQAGDEQGEAGIGGGGGGVSGQGVAGGASGAGGAIIPDQPGTTDPGWTVPEEWQLCSEGACQCADGIDNDGDGLADGFDLECTGPLDDDEGTFATGIPGDNRDPKWQDCFFDGDSGAGNDGCRYATECLTGALPLTDADCTVTQQCLDFCRPLTPNGCDCFGCCTVQQTDGTTVDIMEMPTCSLSNVTDTTACPRCTKSTQCGNTCGECELCLGKTVADLPASCTQTGTGGTGAGGAPPVYTCDNGAQVCGPDAACAASQYCSLGCCIGIVS